MILSILLILVFVVVSLLVFKSLERRTRLKLCLVASILNGAIAVFLVFTLTFLQSDGWKFYFVFAELTFVLIVLIVEFLLRLTHRIESKLGLGAANFNTGGGLQLKAAAFYNSFDYVSRLESAIQDEFLTKDFWDELSLYRTKGMFDRGKNQEIVGNKDIKGKYINVVNGIRLTPNQPDSLSKRILVFGGSTIFSYEVKDDKTPTAFLQQKLNDSGFIYRVENHGVGGASIGDCLRRLHLEKVSENDIVVFLFGDNDIGINSPKVAIAKGIFRKIPFWSELISLLRNKLEIFDWLYLETVSEVFTDLEEKPELLNGTVANYAEISNLLEEKNLRFLFLLQPNLYTKKLRNSFEISLMETYPRHWERCVVGGYGVLSSALIQDRNFEMATDVFDDTNGSPYLDWAHVNSRGNEIIAHRMFQALSTREMLKES